MEDPVDSELDKRILFIHRDVEEGLEFTWNSNIRGLTLISAHTKLGWLPKPPMYKKGMGKDSSPIPEVAQTTFLCHNHQNRVLFHFSQKDKLRKELTTGLALR